MAEYIKREDVGLSDFEIVMCNGDCKEALKMLLEKVDKIPSADVVERKRGKWVQAMGKYDWMVKCSRCNGIPIEISNFCPNCGADMREES